MAAVCIFEFFYVVTTVATNSNSLFHVLMPARYARKGYRRSFSRFPRKPISYARTKYGSRGKGTKAAWLRKPIPGRINEERGEIPHATRLTSTSLAQRGGTLWPERIYTKLKYTELLAFTSTSGAVTEGVFKQNSLFDPYNTGVGHQPLGFDQLAVLYSRYRVFGSKITCRCYQVGSGTTAATSGTVSILSSSSATPSAVGTTIAERDEGVTRTVGANTPVQQMLSASARAGTARGETPAKVRNDPNYEAGIGADPAVLTYWLVYYTTADQATTSICNINTDIEYDCCFFARIQPAQS